MKSERINFEIMVRLLTLYSRAMALQSKISAGGGQKAFAVIDCPVAYKDSSFSAEEIEKIVNRAVRLGGVFGGVNSCLSRSVIRCRLMRTEGIDARVVFAFNREEKKLDGHAWVVWPDGPANPPDHGKYKYIEIHPSPEKFPGWMPDI